MQNRNFQISSIGQTPNKTSPARSHWKPITIHHPDTPSLHHPRKQVPNVRNRLSEYPRGVIPNHRANPTRLTELVKNAVKVHPLSARFLFSRPSEIGATTEAKRGGLERDVDRDFPKVSMPGRDGSECSGDPRNKETVGPEDSAFQLCHLGEVNRGVVWRVI